MKRHLLKGFIVFNILFTGMAYANFTFYSSTPNACEFIPGTWEGLGKITNSIIGECTYHGIGDVSPLDNNGAFTMFITADKNSGPFICPKHSTKQLKGRCSDGVVEIITDYGSLMGNFSQDKGDASGTLSAGAGLTALVVAEFQRMNK